MAKFLIVYATRHGQSKKISEFFQKRIRDDGYVADTLELKNGCEEIELEKYDCVLIGGPVYLSKFPASLKKWVKKNAQTLNLKPSVFFSVCLGVLEKENRKTQYAENKIVESFFKSTGWRPEKWGIFAGALSYSKYNWFVRLIMQRIAMKAGGDTDMTQDYEYTDWKETERFIEDLKNSISKRAVVHKIR